ncbi:MAG: DUF29 domain-containing protein [Pseudomonadota bacterium]
MGKLYDTDILAWASEQAELLRSGKWSALDIENIAEEIEDVGKRVQHELGSRVAVLLAHLLKWQYQPHLRSKSWLATIAVQRRVIARKLAKVPSLKRYFFDEDWLDEAWDDAVKFAIGETNLHEFPDEPVWTAQQILDPDFLPD